MCVAVASTAPKEGDDVEAGQWLFNLRYMGCDRTLVTQELGLLGGETGFEE